MLIQADRRPVEQTLISLENLVQWWEGGKMEEWEEKRKKRERGKNGRRVRERKRDFHTDLFSF